MQEHVHLGECPCRSDILLSPQREVFRADLLTALDQQRTGPARWIADAFSRLRIDQPSDELRDFGGSIELARLLPSVGGELADQVLVGVPDDIHRPNSAGTQVEFRIAEVFQQRLEPVIPLLCLTKAGFRVEVDIAEDTFEFLFVRVFNLVQSRIDNLTNVGSISLLKE